MSTGARAARQPRNAATMAQIRQWRADGLSWSAIGAQIGKAPGAAKEFYRHHGGEPGASPFAAAPAGPGMPPDAVVALWAALAPEWGALVRYAERRRAEDAESLVQEALIALHRALQRGQTFNRPAALAYVYRALRGDLREAWYRRTPPSVAADARYVGVIDAYPSDHDDLYAALAMLNRRQRTAVVLRHLGGWAPATIAQAHPQLYPAGAEAVQSATSIGLRRLRERLGGCV
jgi:DNA-directed RNA polymerase specialized sigma24 family protein